jgi:glycosyltransferase involved in cell wall biosynthesis
MGIIKKHELGKKEWIAYFGKFPFPEGSASSVRVRGIASALAVAGYDVVVGSEDTKPSETTVLCEKKWKTSISYIGLSERVPVSDSIFTKAFRYLFADGKQKTQWLDRQSTMPSFIIYYGSSSSFLLRLMAWCHRKKVRLIVDIVEWRDASHMPAGGFLSPFNISDKICMRYLNHRADGVIAISSYLEKYYLNKKSNVIRIPTLLDTSDKINKRSSTMLFKKQLTLAYAGKSGNGKKDLINNVLEALFLMNSAGKNVRFIVVGHTVKEVLNFSTFRSRGLSMLPLWIEALGWQSPDIAIDIIKNADFLPLFRPINRVSQAGFPTKIAESMSLGTPVICNHTSDLGKYVHDGINGLVCPDHTIVSIVKAIERALRLSPKLYEEMRGNAHATAAKSFNYLTYVEPLHQFLKKS